MSSFLCECGASIRSAGGDLPNAGHLVADADMERVIAATQAEVISFLQSLSAGKRDEWLIKRYGRVIEIDDESIVYESVSRYWISAGMRCFQCPQCQRLLVAPPRRQRELYRSFQPEQPEGKDVFKPNAATKVE